MASRTTTRRSSQRPRPKGATTRRSPRKKQGGGVSIPGWLWGLGGLIAGFALSQYFQETAPPMATVVPKPTSTQGASRQAASDDDRAAAEEEARMPTFEFYTLLPESEVIAPKVDDVQGTPATAAVADVVESDSAVKEPRVAADQGGSYMLQAASFKNAADAKRLAGRLKDFGLLAKITEVKAQGNQTWHRVQVGPYQDTRELNRAQDLMVTQGIEPLMIRLQD
ncbi:Sporulation related domain-containing protein [Modicisalibacter ilicicola DSM 19980]|uniref:Sporulation related domain-containing protein n=1 Tax=Modicisalibacter ilicicola DSM 19980 TaxID=1121942 RepID=A0A1M4V2N8_9GAMM|nr:SPOR domain-containing protein [Halomonas ilicicola]SHE63147.1 Sporulation related domain-containing protein [Halomonas ilicicola DSM 19980]